MSQVSGPIGDVRGLYEANFKVNATVNATVNAPLIRAASQPDQVARFGQDRQLQEGSV